MVGQRELISAFAGVPIQEVRGMRAPFLAVKQNFYEKFLFVTITDYYRFKILVFVVVPIQEVRGMRAPFLAVNKLGGLGSVETNRDRDFLTRQDQLRSRLRFFDSSRQGLENVEIESLDQDTVKNCDKSRL